MWILGLCYYLLKGNEKSYYYNGIKKSNSYQLWRLR